MANNLNKNKTTMSFTKSVGTCFRKYVNCNGRASRSEYWWFQLFLNVTLWPASFVDTNFFDTPVQQAGPFWLILALAILLPSICVSIRRLHDVNKSGWWILIAFTCVGLIPLLIWFISKGSDSPNDYGGDPLQEDGITLT